MKLKKQLLFIVLLFVITTSKGQTTLTLQTTKTQFSAGSCIELKFTSPQKKEYQMYCSNSYGSTMINPTLKNNTLIFTFPSFLSNKTGIVNWQLVKTSLSGTFTIFPKEQPTKIETYLGPPSIEAGGVDFTMLVTIPTDNLDNPLKKDTPVLVKKQFLNSEKQTTVLTNNLIGYKRIFSPLKSGRVLLSTQVKDLNSKEYDVSIVPAIGINFNIYAKRNHAYADGNQITTFYTSIIKDKNKNIVSDGTFVEFFITTKKGAILKTSGTTINGVAFAKMLHPEWEENWTIKAYITGISESNKLTINYKQVIDDFKVAFSKNNRKITVGPLVSFMNQTIPDGLKVKLSIDQHGAVLNQHIEKSKDGFVTFYLDSNLYQQDTYNLEITAAGITKTYQYKKLW